MNIKIIFSISFFIFFIPKAHSGGFNKTTSVTINGNRKYEINNEDIENVKDNSIDCEIAKVTKSEEDEKTVKFFDKMEKKGNVTIITGTSLTTLGIIEILVGKNQINNSTDAILPNGSFPYIFGVFLTGFGASAIITGSILKIVGKNKKKMYRNKLSVNYGINSLELSYRF